MKHTRRDFMMGLFSNIIDIVGEANGRANFQLDKIKLLPDEMIMDLVPCFFKDCRYKVSNGNLYRKSITDSVWVYIAELSEQDLFILGKFQSSMKLRDIVPAYCHEYSLDDTMAANRIKSLFILLIESRICHPDRKIHFPIEIML